MPSKTDDDLHRDNGGRRCGLERRVFNYTCYIPERRAGQERRTEPDRRKTPRLRPDTAMSAQWQSAELD